jgi:hypothetical protein
MLILLLLETSLQQAEVKPVTSVISYYKKVKMGLHFISAIRSFKHKHQLLKNVNLEKYKVNTHEQDQNKNV